jgi:hypothetical protein
MLWQFAFINFFHSLQKKKMVIKPLLIQYSNFSSHYMLREGIASQIVVSKQRKYGARYI